MRGYLNWKVAVKLINKSLKMFDKIRYTLLFLLCYQLSFGQKGSLSRESEMILKARQLVSLMTIEEKVGQMLHDSPAIPRLDIPAYNWWNECLHGVARNGKATVFPQAIGMAAMWDRQQMYKIANAISDEARAKHHYFSNRNKRGMNQGLTFWAPNINLFRDPRWGRGMETYGEDPYLTGELAVPFIKGLQGSDPDYFKVIATAKHFVVHSGPEATRHSFNAQVSDVDFYSSYTPHFKKAVQKGGVYSIMCAYNRLRGTPCCGDKFLENLLRNEWNFKGYIVSDCWAIKDFYEKGAHEAVATKAEAAAMAVKAGTDLNCGDSYPALVEAVKTGYITEEELDRSVERLMLARLKLGVLPADSLSPWSQIPLSVINSENHRQLALETAQKSMVLLKNKRKTLPLSGELKNIAVIGPNAMSEDVLVGNYHGYSDYYVTLFDGIKARNPLSKVVYAPGCRLADELPLMEIIPNNYLFTDEKCTTKGLVSEYFNTINFEGNPVHKRVDLQINFKWWGDKPVPEVQYDNFSIRWTGYIVPPVSGVFYLGAKGTKTYSVFVNDSMIVNMNDTYQTLTEYGTVFLEKGRKYSLCVEFAQHNPESASIQLLWEPPHRKLMEEAIKVAKQSDVVILSLGLSPQLEGEEMKVKVKGFHGGDREQIDLPESQKRLVRAISKTGKPIVIVLTNGSALAFPNEAKHADAILESWYPGEAGGTAIASVLWGDYNPGGRLPVTFYNSVNELPAFDDYTMQGRTYKFFKGKTQFDFGYGLSYSNFNYSDLQLERLSDNLNLYRVEFLVKNVGEFDGDEVCQLYLRNNSNLITSLIGFERLHLKKGEQKKITMHITRDDLNELIFNQHTIKSSKDTEVFVGGSLPQKNRTLKNHLKGKLTL